MVAYIRPVGGEHVTSLSNGYILSPSSAKLASGQYSTVWFDSASNGSTASIHASLYDASGAQVGTESIFAVTPRVNESAVVTALTTGGFAITWYYSGSVIEQLFAANGNKIGGDIALGNLGYYDRAPSNAALSSGGVAVTWGTGGDIGGKVLDASGAVLSSFTIDAGGFENEPRVIGLSTGGFALIWTDQSGLNGDPNIGLLGQMFDQSGQMAGNRFLVNTTTAGAEYAASLAAFSDGGFVATWTENGPNGTNTGGIFAQRFDSSGAKVGGEIVVSDLTPNYQAQSSVIALPFGGYMVTWEDYTRLDGDFTVPSIRAALFDSDGARLGDTIRVNVQTQHSEIRPVLALQSPTTALATWNDGGLGGDTVQVAIDLPTVGTNGADTLTATRLNETLLGRGGDDVLAGNDGANIIDGGAGNDHILAGNGNDTLIGGAGDDVLDGGVGADKMSGGIGDDIYVVDDAGDVIVELADEGSDTIKSSVSYVLGAGVEVETLRLMGTANLDLTGNAGSQSLGGNSGNNVLDGGGGGDNMKGGAGNDTYIVRSAGDHIVEVAGEGDDTVRAAVSFSLGGSVQVEHLATLDAAATTAINLTGNAYSHDIQGNAGINVLTGGTGNDVIAGNGGADTLTGGLGDDLYVITDSSTVIVENAGEGSDTIKASVSYVLGAGVEVETVRLMGAANLDLTGNAGSQSLGGNSGNNLIDGGGGGDNMKGGAGNDTYIVRSAGDHVVEVAGEGDDTVRAALSFSLGGSVQVEHLATLDASATTAINLTGNAYSHDIQGNAGANVLTGGSGDDMLQGFAGNDTLFGGGGADTFVFDHSTGQDIVGDFVSGSDKLDLSAFGFASFQDVLTATHDVGGNAVIDLGGGDSATLTGVATSQLQSGDVILSGVGGQALLKIGFASVQGWAITEETGYTFHNVATGHDALHYIGPVSLPAYEHTL